MAVTIPDQTIAAQGKQPDAMNSLANIMNMANGTLAYKKNSATMQADIAQRQAESQSAQNAATVSTANVQPLIDQQAANTSMAKTGAQSAQFRLHNDYANVANQTAAGLLADPRITGSPDAPYDPEQAAKALSEAQETMIQKGVPKEQALLATAPFAMAVHQPGQVSQMLKNIVLGSQPATQQSATIQPNTMQTDNGQQVVSNNTNPFAQGGTGSQPIAPIQKVLPPTQQTIQGGVPGVIGAQVSQQDANSSGPQGLDVSKLSPLQMQFLAKKDPIAFANGVQHFQKTAGAPTGVQPNNGFVPTGLPVGAQGNIENNVAQMNQHYSGLQDQSSGAQLVQSLQGNIKSLIPGAATGNLADKKSYVSGLMQALGVPYTGDTKTDTDLLEKNLSQLTLGTPGVGRSDAAQMLVQSARPNTKMNAEALNDAIDQVASQVKANMAIRNYLTPYKFANGGQGDPTGYQSARQQIEGVADPRAWQYAAIPAGQKDTSDPSLTARQAFLKKLTPEDRAALIKKTAVLESMGLVQ